MLRKVKPKRKKAVSNKATFVISLDHLQTFEFQEGNRQTFKSIEDAANLSHLESVVQLAHCYELGYGVEPDTQKALKLYKEADQKGHSLAKKRVGVATAAYPAEMVLPFKTFQILKKLKESKLIGCYQVKFKGKTAFMKYYGDQEMAVFMRELQTFNFLFQHPHDNVIQPFGICTMPPALVMELGNRSLGDAIRDNKFVITKGDVIQYALDLAKGLAHLHQYKIILCDLKPDNVILCQPPKSSKRMGFVAKLIDFGSAYEEKDKKRIGQFEGTYPYLSPEIFTSNEYSMESDTWALGLTFWELMTRPPHALYAKEEASPKNFAEVTEVVTKTPMDKYLQSPPDSFSGLFNLTLRMFGPPEKRPSDQETVKVLTEMQSQLSPLEANEVVPLYNFKKKAAKAP